MPWLTWRGTTLSKREVLRRIRIVREVLRRIRAGETEVMVRIAQREKVSRQAVWSWCRRWKRAAMRRAA